jgi:hypothetical protein
MRVKLCIVGLAAPLVASFVVQPAAVSSVSYSSLHAPQRSRAHCLQAPSTIKQQTTALQMTANGQGPYESSEKVMLRHAKYICLWAVSRAQAFELTEYYMKMQCYSYCNHS